MLQVRHRLSSGGALWNIWDYDPARRVLDIVLKQGSADPIAFTLAICAPDRARANAHPMLRLDGDSFRVLPAVFRFESEMLVPHDCALHKSLSFGDALILTHAPPDIDAELSEL